MPLSGTFIPSWGTKPDGCFSLAPQSDRDSEAKRAARKARVMIIILNFTMGLLHNRLPREHHGEEYQNSDGSNIHQNLSHTHKGSVQEYVQSSHPSKASQQVKRAMHNILGVDDKSGQKYDDGRYDQ